MSTSIDDRIQSPLIAEFLGAWRRARKGASTPLFADMLDASSASLRLSIWAWRCLGANTATQNFYCGPDAEAVYGANPLNKTLGEFFPPELAARVSEHLERIVTLPCAHHAMVSWRGNQAGSALASGWSFPLASMAIR